MPRWLTFLLLLAIPLLWWQPYAMLSTDVHIPNSWSQLHPAPRSDGVPLGAVLLIQRPSCPDGYTVIEHPLVQYFHGYAHFTIALSPDLDTAPLSIILCRKEP